MGWIGLDHALWADFCVVFAPFHQPPSDVHGTVANDLQYFVPTLVKRSSFKNVLYYGMEEVVDKASPMAIRKKASASIRG